jgi:hypothetical protein
VFIFLFGGPSQLDMWDMKPQASREIRGDFQPIATSAPGVQVCEHLPLLAGAMHHVCLVRSMHHRMPVHGPACSEIYSGRPYPLPPITDQAPSGGLAIAEFPGDSFWPCRQRFAVCGCVAVAFAVSWSAVADCGSNGWSDGRAVQSLSVECGS